MKKQMWKRARKRDNLLSADPWKAGRIITFMAMFFQKMNREIICIFLWMSLSNEGNNSQNRDQHKKQEVIFTSPGGQLWIFPADTRISVLRPLFHHRWTSFPGTCRSGWSCHWWQCRHFQMPPPSCWPAGSSPGVSCYWPKQNIPL